MSEYISFGKEYKMPGNLPYTADYIKRISELALESLELLDDYPTLPDSILKLIENPESLSIEEKCNLTRFYIDGSIKNIMKNIYERKMSSSNRNNQPAFNEYRDYLTNLGIVEKAKEYENIVKKLDRSLGVVEETEDYYVVLLNGHGDYKVLFQKETFNTTTPFLNYKKVGELLILTASYGIKSFFNPKTFKKSSTFDEYEEMGDYILLKSREDDRTTTVSKLNKKTFEKEYIRIEKENVEEKNTYSNEFHDYIDDDDIY